MARSVASVIAHIAQIATVAIIFFVVSGIGEGPRAAPEGGTEGALDPAVFELQVRAEKGDSAAQFYLGLMYQEGKGVPRDDAIAAKWYRRAAEQGEVEAQTNLGALFHKGRGVAQDSAKAAKWYRRAAEQGHAVGQANLARLYATGEGVPQDDVQAHIWFSLAARQGHAKAAKILELLANRMSTDQIAEAHRRTVEWEKGKTATRTKPLP